MSIFIIAFLLSVMGPVAIAGVYFADLPGFTVLPYNRTPAECYTSVTRVHQIVVTALLPEVSHVVDTDTERMLRSMSNLLAGTQADVVLFTTSSWKADTLAKYLPADTPLHVVCIANEDWTAPRKLEHWEAVHELGGGPGYRSMCRWFSRRVFNALHHMGYEWAIRVDTDSYFPAPIPYNLIWDMQQRGAVYGFRVWLFDEPEVTWGLPEALRYFLQVERLQPTWLLQHFGGAGAGVDNVSSVSWDRQIVYNNFFATRISFWMQPRVQALLRHFEHLYGHYKFRWGDAPIHTLVLASFARSEQLLEFQFEYHHKGVWGENAGTSPFPRLPHRKTQS